MGAIQQAMVMAKAAGGGGPTSDSLLHLHFDGFQGYPLAHDSSGNSRTVALQGRACISTAHVLLDDGALYCAGEDKANNHCRVTYFSDLSSGSGDFTYRFKFRRQTGAPTSGGVFSRRVSAIVTPIELQCSGSSLQLLVGDSSLSGWAHIHPFGVTLAADTTYDIELEKFGSTVRLYIDGVISGSNLTSFAGVPTSTADLYIGAGGDAAFKGWIDEFEFFDYALHSGTNFTPPSAPTVGADDPIAPPSATGAHRYWRARFTQGSVISVKEIEFRPNATGSTGIDQTNTGGTPLAGSTYGGFSVAAAFNGSFTTGDRWASAGGAPPEYLGYDFGSGNDTAIEEVAIGDGGSGQDALWAFIEYSDNGSSWTHYVTVPAIPFASNTFQCFALPA